MNGELKRIRCTICGRFLGFEAITEGVVYIRCPNCKRWSEVKTEGFNLLLTEEEIYGILISRGTKAREG
jgi:phage FluMu protein Com